MPASPLLRSPPFPGIARDVAEVSRIAAGAVASDDAAALIDAIRAARVGGSFWAPSPPPGRFVTILRPRSAGDAASLAASYDDPGSLWALPDAAWSRRCAAGLRRRERAATIGEIDPWPLLTAGTTLVAHGDDEWIALARIAGAAIEIRSPGRFTRIADPAGALLDDVAYRDPFTDAPATALATVGLLAGWRREIDANRTIAVASGFAWWKRREIERFLWAGRSTPLPFVRSTRRAVDHAKRRQGDIAVWPSRVSPALSEAAARGGVGITRVEDGFIRSVGLGSNLFPPYSVTVDRGGIHYDPALPSDLEVLLQTASFPPALIARAEALIAFILAARLGKYGGGGIAEPRPERISARRLVLVPGQVEDDLSVLRGGGSVQGNLDLLARVRALEPDAEIWFRPHPDVDAGHRRGAVRDGDALVHVDRVVRGGGMAPLLETVDGVHVLTSLAGFEALLRGCDVTTHGTPFYAGWGLTRDLAPRPARRTRQLSLPELAAGALILFPRYLDPVTGLPCPVETLAGRLAEQARPRITMLTALRRLQGMFTRWLPDGLIGVGGGTVRRNR